MSVLVRATLVLLLAIAAVPAAAGPPEAGQAMPVLSLPVPQDPAGQAMLGLQGKTAFTLADLPGDLVFIEVIGVYCPQCVKQSPGFKTLFNRLNKGKTKGRVAMFALAAGGTDAEVRQLAATGQYLFPIVSDPEYAAHKTLGEPLTPYTIVCRPDGEVVYAHLGIVEDVDGLYQQIKALLEKG
jgi:hypothetical protein